MYWPNEGSVSTVECASIDETTMEVGKQCIVVQHKYNGMVAAQGNIYIHTLKIIQNILQEPNPIWRSWKIIL